MKKLVYISLFTIATLFTACSGSTGNTGGSLPDSGSAGSSGPADSVGVVTPNNPAGTPANRTDTSTITNGQGAADQTVDTSRNRP